VELDWTGTFIGSFEQIRHKNQESVLRNEYSFSGQVKVKQKMDIEVWFHMKKVFNI
jgi:hypothetical protein